MCTWYLYFTSTSIFSNLELSLPTLLSSRRASCNCHNYEIVITYLYSFPLLINFFSVNIINGMRGILICYKVPSLRKHQELCKLLLPWNQYSISTYIKQILGFFNDLRSNISMPYAGQRKRTAELCSIGNCAAVLNYVSQNVMSMITITTHLPFPIMIVALTTLL